MRQMHCYISKQFAAVPWPLYALKIGLWAKQNSRHFLVVVVLVLFSFTLVCNMRRRWEGGKCYSEKVKQKCEGVPSLHDNNSKGEKGETSKVRNEIWKCERWTGENAKIMTRLHSEIYKLEIPCFIHLYGHINILPHSHLEPHPKNLGAEKGEKVKINN